MELSSPNDLWLVIALSLVGLALIWLSPLQSYPLTLLLYLLLLFLPGYALITAIKPLESLVARIVIGFLLGLLFFLLASSYLNLTYLNGLFTTLLFILAILFSFIAILRRGTRKDKERQLTLDESIRRIKEIKQKSAKEAIQSEEVDEYTPMPAEVDEPSLENRMSVMRLYDTGEKAEAEKTSQLEDFLDRKPIREEILRVKQEKKSGERTIPLPIEHSVKKEDLLSAFQKEMGRPVWLDHMEDDQSGFRNWDLLLALLLSGLGVVFIYYNPLGNLLLTTIVSYAVVLFTVAYTLLVAIFPARRRISLIYRLVISSILTILLLVLVLIFGNNTMITSLPFPLIMLFALATLLLVIVTALRRRSLPPESGELSLKEIIRRSEKMGIIVEHDEETLQVLKDLEKEEEEKPPQEKKEQPQEEQKSPIDEIPVIIVEHDEEDIKEYEEIIIVNHKDEEETEKTPYIIVEHDEKDIKEYEEETTPQEAEKKETNPPGKDEAKNSLLSTEKLAKVDKDQTYPTMEKYEAEASEKRKIDLRPPHLRKKDLEKPENFATEKIETTSKISAKKEVKTEPEHPIKKKTRKKEITPVKEQNNLDDLVIVNLLACLLIIYFIIPLFPKTPFTVIVVNSSLFILASYTLIAAIYPKKYNTKTLVTGILLGILLVLTYQSALFLNYITLFSGNITIWLLISILLLCLIAYYRRGRAAREEKKHPKKYTQNSNIVNLVSNVINDREINKKSKTSETEEDPFKYLRSRAEEQKQAKTDKTTYADKPTKKKPENLVILSVLLIVILITAISATAIYIIKP
jgi:uncharacterized membrane protein